MGRHSQGRNSMGGGGRKRPPEEGARRVPSERRRTPGERTTSGRMRGTDPGYRLGDPAMRRRGSLEAAPERLRRVMEVNFFALVELTRAALPELKRGTRPIGVNLSSVLGHRAVPRSAEYCASKFALESFTGSAAAEVGKFGVTVTAVSLGPVQTGWIAAELEQAILPTIPLARIGTPEDIADVVLFLAPHQARWLTGQRIFVGGGHGMLPARGSAPDCAHRE